MLEFSSSPGETPDWAVLRERILRAVPDGAASPSMAALEGCIFDLRRALLDHLTARFAPESPQWEDMLRETLPPLEASPGPFLPAFSVWRSALTSVLGLLAGSAVVRGVALHTGVSGGLTVLGGMLGAAGALRLVHALSRTSAAHPRRALRRRLGWLAFAAVPAAAAALDILRGRDIVGSALAAVGAFLSQGDALALFSNVYILWAMVGTLVLCARPPVRLDRQAFAERLELAARNWWSGAARAAEALADDARHERRERRWRQVGRELWSLAGELDSPRRQWLEERLRLLGLDAPRHEGALVWSAGMADLYEPLGYLEPGDACYVDMPPLMEEGRMLRKGAVRKVRP